MGNPSNIENAITYLLDDLKQFVNSLQKEFEFFSSVNNTNEKLLNAKKRQIEFLKEMIQRLYNICENAEALNEKTLKLEACVINLGLSKYEINRFLNTPLKTIIDQLKEYQKEGLILVPLALQNDVRTEKNSEIKHAEKPGFIPVEILKEYQIKHLTKKL